VAASLNVFLPYVLPSVMGCPDVMARDRILAACIDFCEQTQAWQDWLTPIDVVANTQDYTLPVPDGAAIAGLEEVKLGDARLDPLTRADALDLYGETWDSDLRGTPAGYLRPDDYTLSLCPIPADSATGLLKVYATLQPARNATTVPDQLAEHHRETIAHGALARLLAVPGQPWSNPPLAAFYAQQFAGQIGSAAGKAAKGLTRRPLRSRTVY
jgi:hypothetical protein